jgi:hypothetical protein
MWEVIPNPQNSGGRAKRFLDSATCDQTAIEARIVISQNSPNEIETKGGNKYSGTEARRPS